MTTDRIDYAPDYKSEKRKPLNPRVKISAGGRPYLDRKEAVRRMLERAPDSPREDIATLARIEQSEAIGAERTRLERQVIEKAKVWRRDMTHKSDAALVRAVDALIDFESEKKG